ncbi:uncharacterized protein [Notamacropus eugenii]|uniref:uncharacterized protein n=1 Tax=Notamacropus eugenii TaxID=9315 RepID=UPI003B677E3F
MTGQEMSQQGSGKPQFSKPGGDSESQGGGAARLSAVAPQYSEAPRVPGLPKSLCLLSAQVGSSTSGGPRASGALRSPSPTLPEECARQCSCPASPTIKSPTDRERGGGERGGAQAGGDSGSEGEGLEAALGDQGVPEVNWGCRRELALFPVFHPRPGLPERSLCGAMRAEDVPGTCLGRSKTSLRGKEAAASAPWFVLPLLLTQQFPIFFWSLCPLTFGKPSVPSFNMKASTFHLSKYPGDWLTGVGRNESSAMSN